MFENGNGNGMYMPVAPAYGGGGFGNGFGGDWGWIILLLLCGWGGMGMGGFGGWGGMMGLGYDFPWLLNGQNQINANTNAGFDHAATQSALGNLSTAVTSGFGDVQNALCGGFAGVNATVNGAQNALAQQLYTGQIADLERSFAAQTANTAGMQNISDKLCDCCCENRLATQGLGNTIIQDGSATRQAIAQGVQSIQDKLCQLELDGVKSDLGAANREISNLQNQLNMAAFRADNVAQTAQLVADNTAQTQYIVNRVAPYPTPAYVVANPYGCGNGYGYGYGGGWNNGFGNVGYGNGSF